jgi:hypothetical protein
MSDQPDQTWMMLAQQLKELDAIERETVTETMNTVRGTEAVRAWKARTVRLIAQQIGEEAARSLAAVTPGPSFTYDLFEEFSDEVELYRSAIRRLMNDLQGKARASGDGGQGC